MKHTVHLTCVMPIPGKTFQTNYMAIRTCRTSEINVMYFCMLVLCVVTSCVSFVSILNCVRYECLTLIIIIIIII